jgi:hypothetical protein
LVLTKPHGVTLSKNRNINWYFGLLGFDHRYLGGSQNFGETYETYPENKDTSRVGRYGNFCAYYGNTAVDLDPLPVSCTRLTVIEQALFEWNVFEMAAPIQSPAKYEVCYIICFLKANGERPAEIHKQIVAVYGNVMIYTCFFTQRNISLGKISTTMMRCKKKPWRG